MKRLLQNMPIRRKQALVLMMTSGLALLLAGAVVILHATYDFRKELIESTDILAAVTGNNCKPALDFNDQKAARESLNSLQAEPAILAACTYDRDKHIFAQYQRAGLTNEITFPALQATGHEIREGQLYSFHEIWDGKNVVGGICVVSNMEEVPEHARTYARVVVLVFLLAMILALFVSSRLHWLISSPLQELAKVTRAVAGQKNYSLRAVKRGRDEIGQLVDAFNEMLTQIQAQDLALSTARDELERRVWQRTHDLQTEVSERRKAQQALEESQSLYHSLVEQMPMGVFRKDKDGRYMYVNSWLCRLKGIKPEAMIGKTPQELAATELAAHDTRLPKVTELAGQGTDHHQVIMQTGQQIEIEEEYPDERGKSKFLHVVKFPVKNPEGMVLGSQGIMFDVTARKEAEAELSYERDLLKALLDNLPDVIYFKDLESRFVRLSKSKLEKEYAASLKRHQDEFPGTAEKDLPLHLQSLEHFSEHMIGRTDAEFISKEAADAFYAEEQKIIRTGEPLIGDLVSVPLLDGRTGWYLRTKMPWRDKNGRIIGTFGTSKDVTFLKEAEAKLAEASALMDTLLANSPDYIYFKDRESRFIRCSASMAAMFKVANVAEVVGKRDGDFFAEDHALAAAEDETKIMRTGEPIIGKTEKETWPDGHVTWALTAKMPLRDASNEIVGTFGISKDITPIKDAEARLKQVHSDLVQTSRRAGMADVATSVLHNVGNVLNSVNTSADLLVERLRKSKVTGITRVVDMLNEHKDDLLEFLGQASRREQFVTYLKTLSEHLAGEQKTMLTELEDLSTNVDHIKEIVAMQQSYAKVSGVQEIQSASLLMEDAIRMHAGALVRHEVRVVRDYEELPDVPLDKHKVLQILVNLISNAKYAMSDATTPDRTLTVGIKRNNGSRLRFLIKDTGMGIPKENLTRIFSLGFTTRDDGHGFGLHSGFLSAREMGGELHVQSEGPGKGATFVLELPMDQQEKS